MDWIWPETLAASIAALITLVELVTSKYPHSHFALWRRWQLWAYVAIYGGIGFALMFVVDLLVSGGLVKLEGLGIDRPWVQAVIIGITTKALMKVTLFNVGGGLNPTPIGISTLVQLFEPWLLDGLDLGVWNALREAIRPHAARHADLAAVKTAIEANVPTSLSKELQAMLLSEVEAKKTVEEAMEIFLRYTGCETLRRVFPT